MNTKNQTKISKKTINLSNNQVADFVTSPKNEAGPFPDCSKKQGFLEQFGTNLVFCKWNDNPRFDVFFKKLTNLIMIDGKKAKAIKILFKMLLILKIRIKRDLDPKNPTETRNVPFNFALLQIVSKALENTLPSLEVRKVRIAGSTYLVPAVLSKKKQETLALKWIIDAAKKRQKTTKLDFSTCLADEIFEASRKLGHARQKRDELHRLAQMNRAYIRYRWW